MGEMSFSLAYGTKVIVKIEKPSWRVVKYFKEINDIALQSNLDFLEEGRKKIATREVMYHSRMARAYNHKVQAVVFKIEDLVSRKMKVMRKLDLVWEGPCKFMLLFNCLWIFYVNF